MTGTQVLIAELALDALRDRFPVSLAAATSALAFAIEALRLAGTSEDQIRRHPVVRVWVDTITHACGAHFARPVMLDAIEACLEHAKPAQVLENSDSAD